MSLASTPLRAALQTAWLRARVRLIGTRFRERHTSRATADELLRIDICASVAQALGMIDTIRAAPFQARHLLLALRSGDIYRAARALAVEASYCASAGQSKQGATQRLLEAASALAARSGDDCAIGLTKLVAGMARFFEGDWKRAVGCLDDAECFLRERCIGVTWELATARFVACVGLFFLGELAELRRRLPGLIQNAEERGDWYEATDLRIRISHALHLADDSPEPLARKWSRAFPVGRPITTSCSTGASLIAQVEIALYSGRGMAAWKLIARDWPALCRSFLLRVQYIAVESYYQRACAAVAASRGGVPEAERRSLIHEAERAAGSIERENIGWGRPYVNVIRAAIAATRDSRERAFLLLSTAETGFEAANMGLFAAAARRRRGQITGGETRAAL